MTDRILCATDGARHSGPAVQLAAQMAEKLGIDLAVCYVNVARGGVRGPLIFSVEASDAKAIVESAAAAAIVQYAETNGFTHIVTGTGDKHGVSRLMLGSVAADVAHRAHCTVTIARG